jgi:hypothetical protein
MPTRRRRPARVGGPVNLSRYVPSRAEIHHRALHRAVVIRNNARRFEWKALSRRGASQRVEAEYLYRRASQPFAAVRGQSGDPRLDDSVNAATNEWRVSYISRYRGDSFIEPRYGYVVDKPLHLVSESMPYSDWSKDPERWHLIGFPSVWGVLNAELGRRPVERAERVLSLRFYWEDNYFHFLNDILPRLRMAHEHEIPLDVAVVVGQRLAKQKFFREAFPDGVVDGRRVIVQRDAFIAADEIIVACPEPCARENFSYVADLLSGPRCPRGTRRIFVDRATSRGRHIRNLVELRPALRRHGVEVVDPESMTLRQQVAMFAGSELIAGIHGAGLGNMLFRRNAPAAVLEIFQPLEAPPWFAHMAAELGYAYDALSGYTNERMYHRMQPFLVDPVHFEEKLAKLVVALEQHADA